MYGAMFLQGPHLNRETERGDIEKNERRSADEPSGEEVHHHKFITGGGQFSAETVVGDFSNRHGGSIERRSEK